MEAQEKVEVNAEWSKRIESLYALCLDGWDGEDALALPYYVLERAEEIVLILSRLGQPVWNVVPGPKGEVVVEIRNGERSIEFIVYSQKSVYVQFAKPYAVQTNDLRLSQIHLAPRLSGTPFV